MNSPGIKPRASPPHIYLLKRLPFCYNRLGIHLSGEETGSLENRMIYWNKLNTTLNQRFL